MLIDGHCCVLRFVVLYAGRGKYDVVLSSGFLAFAQHTGFLQAVEDVGSPCSCDCVVAVI
jgi:hypothetical protein